MEQSTVGITTIGDRPDHWEDAVRVLGPSVDLLQESVDLQRMSAGGYDDAQERGGWAAQRLVARGAAGVMIGGTLFTFYRGHPFHNDLLRRVREATGVPVSSTSLAMLDGLRTVGARKLAVATAYTADVD
jgi:arylmalonate decarboxylase